MCIYTCIMQIEQRTKIWSLLLVTINKILCQFFEFTQNLKRSPYLPLNERRPFRLPTEWALFFLLVSLIEKGKQRNNQAAEGK